MTVTRSPVERKAARVPEAPRLRVLLCLVLAAALLAGGSITSANAGGLPAAAPEPERRASDQMISARLVRDAATGIKAASDAQLPVMNGAGLTVAEFATSEGGQLSDITAGPDGNLWFSDHGSSQIGRITPAGVITTFDLPAGVRPWEIVTGADANLWFTTSTNSIGRITTAGVVSVFPTGMSADEGTYAITAAADGNVWFTVPGFAEVGRMTPQGAVAVFSQGVTAGSLLSITGGADGNVWYTSTAGRVGRVTPAGVVTEFALGSAPAQITSGPDGNVWFVDQLTNGITRVTPTGQGTFFGAGITADANLSGIAHGPDGNLWFGEAGLDKVARITPNGVVTEFDLGIAPFSNIFALTAGPDGTLWFTESNTNKIGRISGFGETGAVVPGAPGTPTAYPQDRAVRVTWNPPTSDGGSPVTSYTAIANPGGRSCTWVNGPLECTITGLTGGTPYAVRVQATNAVGSGPLSPPSIPAIPSGLPAAPASVPGNGGFTVPASSPGVRPGVSLATGQTMTVRASGVGTYGNEGEPTCSGVPMTDPTGRRSRANGTGGQTSCAIKPGSGALTSSAPIGALVARTSGSDWTAVFSTTAVADASGAYVAVYTATAPGAVTFAYNDTAGSGLANNGGSYQVSAYTTQSLDAAAEPTPVPSVKAQGGETIGFYANGLGSYGYDGQPGCTGEVRTDAAGNRAVPDGSSAKACSPLQKLDPSALLPSAPIGALIVRVGSGRWMAPFYSPSAPKSADPSAGYFATVVSDADGQDQIAYNDVPGGGANNTGGYEVSVYPGWYGSSGAAHPCHSIATTFSRPDGSALPKPLPADGSTQVKAVAKVTDCLTGAPLDNEPFTFDVFWPNGTQAKAGPTPTGGGGLVNVVFTTSTTPGSIFVSGRTHSRDLNGPFVSSARVDQVDPSTANEAATSIVTTDRSSVPADGTSRVVITVHLKDGLKQPIAGATVALSAPANSNVFCVSSCSAKSDQNGRAAISVFAKAPGVVPFTVTDQTNNVQLAKKAEITFEALPSQRSNSYWEVDSWVAPADGASPIAVTGVMRDGSGKPIVGTWVEIWPQSGSRAWCLTSCGAFTDANGRATVKIVDKDAEKVLLTISDRFNNVTLSSYPTITFERGSELTNSKVTIDRSSVPADGITPVTVTVQLRDGANQPIRGARVGVEATSGTHSGSLASSNPVTDANGIATFNMVSSVVETVQFTFTDQTNGVRLHYALLRPTVQYTTVPGPTITSITNITRPDASGSDVLNQSSDGVMAVYPGDVVEITGTRLFGSDVVLHWGSALCYSQPQGDSLWRFNTSKCTTVSQSEPGVVLDPAGTKIRLRVPTRAGSGVNELYLETRTQVSNKRLVRFRTDYVALGDSFSSGEGAADKDDLSGKEFEQDTWKVPVTPSSNPSKPWADNCHRSGKAYPYLVNMALYQASIPLTFEFVACSGGIIANMAALHAADPRKPTGTATTSDGWVMYPNEGPDLQVGKLTKGTAVVTVTAGGNDLGFAPILGYCYAFRNPLSGSQDCSDKFIRIEGGQPEDTAANNIAAMYPRLLRLYQTIRRLSGNAPVYVKGYPHLLKRGDGNEDHFTNKTKDYFLERQDFLDFVMAQAAKAAGVHFIVDGGHMDGHTFDAADPWLHTLDVGRQLNDGEGTGKYAFHPTIKGQSEAAKLFLGKAGASLCTSGSSSVQTICDVTKLQPNPDPVPNLQPVFNFGSIKLGAKVPDHWWAFDRIDPSDAFACGALPNCDFVAKGGKKAMDPDGTIHY